MHVSTLGVSNVIVLETSLCNTDVLVYIALSFCSVNDHYMAITESTATRYTPVRYAKVKLNGSKQQQKQQQQQQQQQQEQQQQGQQQEQQTQ
jgi:hypothetical protein